MTPPVLNEQYIRDNWETQTDVEMAAALKTTRDSIRWSRRKLRLLRGVFDRKADADGFEDWKTGWHKTDDASIFYENPEDIKEAKDNAEQTIAKHGWKEKWLKTKEGKIHVINREPSKDFVNIEKLFRELLDDIKTIAPIYPPIERFKVRDGHLLVVDIADLHVGKYIVGGTYDPVKVCLEALDGLIAKASGFNIDNILFVIGNDVLHVDGPSNSTTKGTPQDTVGLWYENFTAARRMYTKAIEKLITVAPVSVVHNSGNHDVASSFYLADSLASWFHNNQEVTFDVSASPRKYFKYGSSMIATTHGDGARDEKIGYLMAHESPEMWAQTRYRIAYLHHQHHKRVEKFQGTKDFIGFTVEYLRSPSPADGWHDKNGYINLPAAEAFIHSKDRGQIARLTQWTV